MTGDFSRFTFDPKKHFDSVLMQQGRVQLDADWNEQREIAAHRIETATIDLLGPSGAPEDDAGFAIWPAYALDFDGVDDHVILGSREIGGRVGYPAFTLDVRVCPRAGANGGTVLSSLGVGDVGEYTLEVDGEGTVVFRMFVSATDQTTGPATAPAGPEGSASTRVIEARASRPIPFDRLSHLTVTVAGGEAVVYLDGEIAATSGETNATFRAHLPLVVGASVPHGRGADHFAGVIADVRFWTVALSATDVIRHHERGLDETDASLAGHWPLDEGAGQAANDRSGNGNHGTLGGGVPDFCPTWVFHDLAIGRGRYYVDGILCENERAVQLTDQPDDPGEKLSAASGSARYLVYLDVWKRNLTAIEDPTIREVGLGGPDTTTRLKTVWQVKLLPVTGHGESGDGASPARQWDEHVQRARSRGMLRARRLRASTSLGNQLYRVEIHQGERDGASPSSAKSEATFKWSRDNGAIAYPVRAVDPASGLVTLNPFGRDCTALRPGDWVELTDDRFVLQGRPAPLSRIVSVDYARQEVVLSPAPADDVARDPSRHPLLRRWDQTEANGAMAGGALTITRSRWLPLEDGIQVWFEESGPLRASDYWLIPARTATEDVEWPRDDAGPIPQPPFGVVHHLCLLAEVRVSRGHVHVRDHRRTFPPLTALRARAPRPAESTETVVEETVEVIASPAPTPSTEIVVREVVEETGSRPPANGSREEPVVDVVVEENVARIPPGFAVLGQTSESPPGYAFTGSSFMTFGRSRRKVVPMRNLGRLSPVVVGGRIYIFAESGEVWVYDPTTDQVEPRASMRPARYGFGIAVAHSRIYLFGGVDLAGGMTDRTSEYDPEDDRWTNRMPMRSPRTGAAGAAVDGKVYAIGGETTTRLGALASRLNEEYDPVRDRWSEREPMPTARAALCAVAVEGRVYTIGGETRSLLPGVRPRRVTVNEQYDPKSNAWHPRQAASTSRGILALAALDGKVYALGEAERGHRPDHARPFAIVEEYDPAIDYWINRAAVATPRHLDGMVATRGELHAIGKDASDERVGMIETIASCFYIHRRADQRSPRPMAVEEPSHART